MENIERSVRINLLRDILVTDHYYYKRHVPVILIHSLSNEDFDLVFQQLKKFSPKIQHNLMIMLSDIRQLLGYYSTNNIHSVCIQLGQMTLVKVLLNPNKEIMVTLDYHTYLKELNKKLQTQQVQVSQILGALLCLFFILLIFK